jgi:hypothetical protein
MSADAKTLHRPLASNKKKVDECLLAKLVVIGM